MKGREHARGRPVKLSDELVAKVETTEGRKKLAAVLNKRPYPHYKPVPDHPELVCRIEADGTESVGHFVGREFQAVKVDR